MSDETNARIDALLAFDATYEGEMSGRSTWWDDRVAVVGELPLPPYSTATKAAEIPDREILEIVDRFTGRSGGDWSPGHHIWATTWDLELITGANGKVLAAKMGQLFKRQLVFGQIAAMQLVENENGLRFKAHLMSADEIRRRENLSEDDIRALWTAPINLGPQRRPFFARCRSRLQRRSPRC